MTDSSDCESDAGASPSVSSDESSTSSSRCSSPTALKIVTPIDVQPPSTPKRKVVTIVSPPTVESSSSSLSLTATPGTSHHSLSPGACSTPLSTGRRPTRRRQICLPDTPIASTSHSVSSIVLRPSSSRLSYSSSSAATTPRKRKRTPSKAHSSPQPTDHHHGEDPNLSSPDKKRKRNKRRRTRSERNFLAGKTTTTPGTAPVVAEGEEAVALDAEIDRVLEEKAIKNNLSAINVKSIIRHVITNNMVQKMIMSAMKKKVEAGGDAGGSSDEDGLLEPKMTRAKTKELMGNKQISLWPIVDSPVKISKQPVSETHMLIHNDLPEDSSGDEEYVPKETDIHHSDDEVSVASSHTSDVGSPAVPVKQGMSTRRSMQCDRSPFTDSMFKTPPPRPTAVKKYQPDSAIGLRTRSKLPLNDTPLEDLERQLVPPDITKDMYDWGTETDNEDYLAFLKDFLNPGHQRNDANEMDDDADPEYNVMEDDEDLHDREELRMDRAVKVPKKELTQLIAELFEPGGMLSGDDMEDHDLATLTGITPLVNDSGFTDAAGRLEDTSVNSTVLPNSTVDTSTVDITDSKRPPTPQTQESTVHIDQEQPGPSFVSPEVFTEVNNNEVNFIPEIIASTIEVASTTEETPETKEIFYSPPYFQEGDLNLLKHQMRQHVQLLTQSYVLTVSNEDPCLKNIAKSTKMMVNEIRNCTQLNGPSSVFSVCNIQSAWNLVNFWPHRFVNKSPIKKKILEIKYISERGFTTNEEGKPTGNQFPRHVVKVIAENNAFLYNSLLPESYSQKEASSRCLFTVFEDLLLVKGLEQLKDLKLSTSQKAEALSETLLVSHTTPQVYHRIRNLRKNSQKCNPDIKRYFTDGVIPETDRTVPELSEEDQLPLIQRNRLGLSKLWTALLQHYEDSSRLHWEEKLRKDPVTKSIGTKWNRIHWKKRNGARQDPPTFSNSDTINRVFPEGAIVVDKQDPSMKTIPVVSAAGRVGAFIIVPRLNLNLQQNPVISKMSPVKHRREDLENECPVSPIPRLNLNLQQKPVINNLIPTPEKDRKEDLENEDPDSPAVIMEGTEVELTSDEDTGDEELSSLKCRESIEMVTLSSDEDEAPVKLFSVQASGSNRNGDGGNSPKKTDNSGSSGSSSKQGNSTNPTSSNNVPSSSSASMRGVQSSGDGRGDDSDEDDERRKDGRKRPLPKDYNGDDDHQEKEKQKRMQSTPIMQAPPPPPSSNPPTMQQVSTASSSSLGSSNKHAKKAKRSPGCPDKSKSKVSSKYNVAPPETMIEDTPEEYEDVADAYMEAYLARVQSVTETNHPGTYANFTQLLVEFGENPSGNKAELHAKVKVLFKDYPELMQDFESILNDTIASSYDVTSPHGDTMAEINFIQMVEKYTEKCPALKAKIMNKFKSLKEKPNFTEKDMAAGLEPFFAGHKVMMEAFKAILPSVYRPQSVSSDMDFEVLELDMDDPPQQKGDVAGNSSNEQLHFETVKLPDETQVPATNTCPCVCHMKTNDPAFSSRSKHCEKCSLKFQDGKIFYHNGRHMRPVSVELTPLLPNKTGGPGPVQES